jgi:enoyl reductase-like protein
LAARVAIVKARIAKQKSSVTLEHHWQVACVRNRFRDFQRRVEQLYEASEENLEEAGKDSELAWKDLEHAVAALLSAVPSQRAE